MIESQSSFLHFLNRSSRWFNTSYFVVAYLEANCFQQCACMSVVALSNTSTFFSIGCLAFVSKYLHDFLNNWVASLCQLELFMINFACKYTSKFAMVIPPFEDHILRKEVWKTSKLL